MDFVKAVFIRARAEGSCFMHFFKNRCEHLSGDLMSLGGKAEITHLVGAHSCLKAIQGKIGGKKSKVSFRMETCQNIAIILCAMVGVMYGRSMLNRRIAMFPCVPSGSHILPVE